MNNPFPIDKCPLCEAPLARYTDNQSIFDCRSGIVNSKSDLSHYTVFTKGIHRKNTHQMLVLPPFLLDTKEYEDQTRIHRYGNGGSRWIANIPRINEFNNISKLIERLKLLTVFS